MTARCDRDRIAFRRDLRRAHIVQRVIQPTLALIVAIANQSEAHQSCLARGQVIAVDVSTAVIINHAIMHVRLTHQPAFRTGFLTHIVASFAHGPDIVRAGLVGNEIDAAIPVHRMTHACAMVGCEACGFNVRAHVIAPELRHRAAAILNSVVVGHGKSVTGKEDRTAVFVERGLIGFHQRNISCDERVDINRLQNALPRARNVAVHNENLTIRRPATQGNTAAAERHLTRRTTGDRHDVNLGRSVIVCLKRNPCPVRRQHWRGFRFRVRRHAEGGSTSRIRLPEVTLARKNQNVIVCSRGLVIPLRLCGCWQCECSATNKRRHKK